MESIVLAVRYNIAPIGPPNIKKNSGEIMPSMVFSDIVSTVARVISLSSRSSVSRPTIHETRCLASSIRHCLSNLLISNPAAPNERGEIVMYTMRT